MKSAILVALAFFISAMWSGAFAAETNLQWGVNRAVNPWNVCVYDSTNVCQTIFTLPSTGGGALVPVVNGGTGVSSPSLFAGTNITITGTWPNQTITDTSVNSGASGNVAYYAGTGAVISGESVSALLDSSIGSTQGTIIYRGASTWGALTPGTNGYFLETQGASANPTWAPASGGTGCVSGGSSGNMLTSNGAGGCTTDTNTSLTNGALSLGSSGTVGSVQMGNATSGTITVQPTTGALGSVTLTLPAATDTLAALAASQTLTNKTMSGSSNTFSNIAVASLVSSSTTVNGATCTLGSSCFVGATVATNSALKAVSISGLSAGTAVTRAAYAASGDSGPVTYSLSLSPCSLSAGAGDNGSQVKPTVGTGCWLWNPPAGGVTPMAFGAAGNGSTLDTTAVQAAHEATALAGIPLRFDNAHLYKVGTLLLDTPGDWEGPFRYGAWSTSSSITKCPWGLIANSTSQGDIIHGTAITGTIRGVCIDATGSQSVQASAGAGIDISPTTTAGYQSGWTVEFNTILNAYDGIAINGAGYNAACCGAGSAADGVSVAKNTIINPARYGISNGLLTAGATTVGISYIDNVIICGINGATHGIAGFALFDGGITYDGTNNGPEGCAVGFLIAPSSVSNGVGGYVAQNAQLVARGVLGDQSVADELLIKPNATGGVGGVVDFIQCDGCWVGATSTDQPVSIDCTIANTSCQEITFSDIVAHSGSGYTGDVFGIYGGSGGPYDVSIIGGTICSFGNAGVGSTALNMQLGSGATGRYIVNGVRLGNGCPGGHTTNGIKLAVNAGSLANGAVTITSNDISNVTTPLVYTPSAADKIIVANNLGIDEETGSVAAAASISLNATFPTYGVTGASTTITTISGQWTSRQVILIPVNSQTFNTGGNLCNAVSASANSMVIAKWNQGLSCWNLK